MKSRAESNGGKVQYLDVHKAELEVGKTFSQSNLVSDRWKPRKLSAWPL